MSGYTNDLPDEAQSAADTVLGQEFAAVRQRFKKWLKENRAEFWCPDDLVTADQIDDLLDKLRDDLDHSF